MWKAVRIPVVALLGLCFAAAAGPAKADPYKDESGNGRIVLAGGKDWRHDYGRHGRGYGDWHRGRGHGHVHYYRPRTKVVVVERPPVRVIRRDRYIVRDHHHHHYDPSARVLGVIVGAVVGGAVGDAIDRSDYRY